MMSIDVATFRVPEWCNFIHIKFNAIDTSLVTQAVSNGEAMNAPIDFVTLALEQLCSLFYKQSREHINKDQHMPFKICNDELH